MATKDQVDRVIAYLETCPDADIRAGIGHIFGLGSDPGPDEFRRKISDAIDGEFAYGIVDPDKAIVFDNLDIWDGPSVWKDNFFHNGEWSDADKQRYREWLSRQSDSHPAKSDPEPWLR